MGKIWLIFWKTDALDLRLRNYNIEKKYEKGIKMRPFIGAKTYDFLSDKKIIQPCIAIKLKYWHHIKMDQKLNNYIPGD